MFGWNRKSNVITLLKATILGELPNEKPEESLSPAIRRLVADAIDVDYYLSNYVDVRAAGVDPVTHYLQHGWLEGRNPSANFNTTYYIERHLTPFGLTVCPLVHYVAEGRANGLVTMNFDPNNRFLKIPDAKWAEFFFTLIEILGIQSSLFEIEKYKFVISPMFSPDFYRKKRGLPSDLSDIELLTRYLTFDLAAGLPPGPLFDEDYYRSRVGSVGLPALRADQPAYLHWLEHGLPRHVCPTPCFSEKTYIKLNKDLANFTGWTYLHWVTYGLQEGRRFSEAITFTKHATGGLARRRLTPQQEFVERIHEAPGIIAEINRIEDFMSSDFIKDLIRSAVEIEPEIGYLNGEELSLVPPFNDGAYFDYMAIRRLVPVETADAVILMPFCKLGGADYVASVLAHSLSAIGKVVILRTEQADWARPDWFPDNIVTVDLSQHLSLISADQKMRILYELIRTMKVANVFNVNSRLAFNTFVRYGERLALQTRLHAYYFCADRTREGVETGYPVWYFANILPYLSTAIIDNADLAETLKQRYGLPEELCAKVQVVYTPVMGDLPTEPVVLRQTETKASRPRPVMLWAGRFDRQKRFDLVIEIARRLPGIDFHCWGEAVLDAPPNLSALPANVVIHAPFTSYEELPLRNADGWIYTSAWDGLPTILIECAALGMPIVASASGGVPELVDNETGWSVAFIDDVAAYACAIEDMLNDDAGRVERASRLQKRALQRHNREIYRKQIMALSTAGGLTDVR